MKLNRIKSYVKRIIKAVVPSGIRQLYRKLKLKLLMNYFNFKETRELLRFDIHVTDHCNLNCAGCEHFSPLAEEKYLDAGIFERDCSQLNKLIRGIGGGGIDCGIEYLGILGGEPLLHPNINRFMEISRKYFPQGQIAIVTNGILLDKQPDTFWQACKQNTIDIVISVYPVKINHSTIKEKAVQFGVKIIYWGDPINMTKDWRKLRIDLKGSRNPVLSNNLCYASNACFQLVDGKLYKCWRIAYIQYFNTAFNQKLEVTKNDYIDIFKVKNIKEILKKLRKPFPFCRYCNMEEPETDLKWKVSRKQISEWI
jgi:MoaA/NifB/PqqE/SkfB family radical SAM enzyme